MTTKGKLELDYSAAHQYVESMSHRGYFWDGWDIVRWVPNESGYSSKRGSFKNNKWGIIFRSPVDNDGIWRVKNV
jgi:hypothetical protein